jgi:hypothetical protein
MLRACPTQRLALVALMMRRDGVTCPDDPALGVSRA